MPGLNAVLAAAAEACDDHAIELFGFVRGWQGIINKEYVSLSHVAIDPLIGGTLLKSSRTNLATIPDGVSHTQRSLRQLGIDGLIVIGGEDTLSNCFTLPEMPQVLISKTIDNDVGIIDGTGIVNYFTLGFPTAARKISSFVSLQEGLRTTAYSHERIIVVESMGMHAGWLALSSAMGHPDFIVLPEFPLDYERFLANVAERHTRQRHVIVVIAEGARFAGGSYVSADELEPDDFGHPRFKGSAEALAGRLKEDLKRQFDTRNVNAVNPSYLYRSGTPCSLDLEMATQLGKEAVRLIADGIRSSVFLAVSKEEGTFSLAQYPLAHTQSIAQLHRFVGARFYDPATYSIAEEGKDYLSPLVPELPLEPYGI